MTAPDEGNVGLNLYQAEATCNYGHGWKLLSVGRTAPKTFHFQMVAPEESITRSDGVRVVRVFALTARHPFTRCAQPAFGMRNNVEGNAPPSVRAVHVTVDSDSGWLEIQPSAVPRPMRHLGALLLQM